MGSCKEPRVRAGKQLGPAPQSPESTDKAADANALSAAYPIQPTPRKPESFSLDAARSAPNRYSAPTRVQPRVQATIVAAQALPHKGHWRL